MIMRAIHAAFGLRLGLVGAYWPLICIVKRRSRMRTPSSKETHRIYPTNSPTFHLCRQTARRLPRMKITSAIALIGTPLYSKSCHVKHRVRRVRRRSTKLARWRGECLLMSTAASIGWPTTLSITSWPEWSASTMVKATWKAFSLEFLKATSMKSAVVWCDRPGVRAADSQRPLVHLFPGHIVVDSGKGGPMDEVKDRIYNLSFTVHGR